MKKIKRIIPLILITIIFITNITSTLTFANQPITVMVNEQPVQFDVQPQIIDGRTMVPMRAIFEAMGAQVLWNGKIQGIHVSKYIGNEQKTINMLIGNKKITVNGVNETIDVAPQIIDGRTFVPIRVIAQGLGATVDWDSNNFIVKIKVDIGEDLNQPTYNGFPNVPNFGYLFNVKPIKIFKSDSVAYYYDLVSIPDGAIKTYNKTLLDNGFKYMDGKSDKDKDEYLMTFAKGNTLVGFGSTNINETYMLYIIITQ